MTDRKNVLGSCFHGLQNEDKEVESFLNKNRWRILFKILYWKASMCESSITLSTFQFKFWLANLILK